VCVFGVTHLRVVDLGLLGVGDWGCDWGRHCGERWHFGWRWWEGILGFFLCGSSDSAGREVGSSLAIGRAEHRPPWSLDSIRVESAGGVLLHLHLHHHHHHHHLILLLWWSTMVTTLAACTLFPSFLPSFLLSSLFSCLFPYSRLQSPHLFDCRVG
jgi:hypothetical protein